LSYEVPYKPSEEALAILSRITDAKAGGGYNALLRLLNPIMINKPDTILLDCPEHFLDINAQRKVLVEIANLPFIKRIICATHSPFLFDNSLNHFAIGINETV